MSTIERTTSSEEFVFFAISISYRKKVELALLGRPKSSVTSSSTSISAASLNESRCNESPLKNRSSSRAVSSVLALTRTAASRIE